MVLRLYIDLMSQPCRAVTLFVRANNIACEEIQIAIRKAQHQTEAFAQINPFQKLPAIDHDGFKLTESVAILPYLCRVFPVPEHWYPKNDIRKVARIESYMAWQHLNLRSYGSQYLRMKMAAYTSGVPADEGKLANISKGLETVLKQIETIWLKDRPFIATDELSIADLLAVCELEQPIMGGYAVTAGRPKVEEYMKLVRSLLQPHYDDVHQIVYSVREKLAKPNVKAKL